MKISISYPPLFSEKGVPLLGQNRQFQWFKSPTYIYPMVPSFAASLLAQNGHEVFWDDYIAQERTIEQYYDNYVQKEYDVVLIETKTPVVKMHWEIINRLKSLCPHTIIVLVGDHVTAMPSESMESCQADCILTGGYYDFLLDNLCNYLNGKEALLPGIWYRDENKQVINTGKFNSNHDLNTLPMIDRDLTQWHLYSEKNGNYKRLPGTYTMAARDCWYHKCTFCSWTTLYPEYRSRTPQKLLEEIGILIEKYKVKEIMDDSGAFPVGDWLREFCNGMISRGYNKKIIMDCNMRFGALSFDDYKLMRKAGFRFVLFGLESSNQESLDKIHKGLKIEDMIESCKLAHRAGLSPHVTIMFGYPWETAEMIQNTVKTGLFLLKKGYAHTLQSTIVIPYPGTPLFEDCREKNLLQTLDWDEYDMRRPIMKTPVGDEALKDAVQAVYKVAFSPEFLFRRVIGIRSFSDVKFLFRAAGKVIGHLTDFKK